MNINTGNVESESETDLLRSGNQAVSDQKPNRCKTVAEMVGGGPEALREVYESLSIGFQGNRALRMNT
jgi:hypothetical protein